MANETQPLAAHVARLALAHQILIPLREVVDAAPRDLLLGGDETGHVVRVEHALAPVAEVVARDELHFERTAHRAGAGSSAEIVVGQAVHDAKAHTATFKELDRFAPAI